MTPRQECLAIIERIGADVLDNNEPHVLNLNLWSPPGVIWTATGCHALVAYDYGSRPLGWKSLLRDLRLGVEPCTTPNCEGCEQ